MSEDRELTVLLNRLGNSRDPSAQRLLPLVYGELKMRASSYLRREREDHTLDTTALVHESYLKLAGPSAQQWQSRGHFFAMASVVMRHIIIDHARGHLAGKRGGGQRPLDLDSIEPLMGPERAGELLALDEALDQLAGVNRRAAEVVQCKFFAGLTNEETAEALGVAPVTVRRDWNLAAAWLKRRMSEGGTG